ncbi:3-isopropylmalate dehydrogenase [Pradoshia sp. D12]|nr:MULTISPECIES: hypothetical protein [Bacillaceae]OCA89641.1 hypothetical protein A8L44_01485 [Bacillus sp. FJAT-27986]QFK70963.1 3-isopropylmalate dehydrogenase [Pradoshia sp. D12]TPF72755.1 3-isopropylmalate dehydrogenase [Bacillus sp. D12]
MIDFFLFLMIIFILAANLIAFFVFNKKRNLYLAALVTLLLAGVFGLVAGMLAVWLIEDGFAFFYGFNIAAILLWNSIAVFLIAIIVSLVKLYRKQT